MDHMHDEIRIDVPVKEAWAYFVDPINLTEWSPQARYTDITGPLDQVGTTMVQHWRVLGFDMKGEMEILEVEPERSLRMHAPAADATFLFTPDGDATVLAVDSDYEMPAYLPGFVKDLMNRTYIERNMRHQLELIKALAEAKAKMAVPA